MPSLIGKYKNLKLPLDTHQRVISGFPGVGKSTAFKSLKEHGIKVLDSDSSTFDKAHFPDNYLKHIEDRLNEGYVLLISSHEEVRKGLEKRGIDYTLVYPEAEAKEEYLQRYRERGSPDAFVEMMDKKWEEFIMSCEESGAKTHVRLYEGVYLDTALGSMNWYPKTINQD